MILWKIKKDECFFDKLSPNVDLNAFKWMVTFYTLTSYPLFRYKSNMLEYRAKRTEIVPLSKYLRTALSMWLVYKGMVRHTDTCTTYDSIFNKNV